MFLFSSRRKIQHSDHLGLIEYSQGRNFAPGVQSLAFSPTISGVPRSRLYGAATLAGNSPSPLLTGFVVYSRPTVTTVSLGGQLGGALFTDSLLVGNDDTLAI